jgi:hypothetical protein
MVFVRFISVSFTILFDPELGPFEEIFEFAIFVQVKTLSLVAEVAE